MSFIPYSPPDQLLAADDKPHAEQKFAQSLGDVPHDVVLFPLGDHCEDDVGEALALSSSSYQSV